MFKEYLGVVVTAFTAIAFIVGGLMWLNSNYATSADLTSLRAEVKVVKLQTEDALDARIEYVLKEIGRLKGKLESGKLSPIEEQHLGDMQREYERLRKLRYGDK